MSFALGIDLGGSSVKAVAVTPEGRLLGETNVPFDAGEPGDWARRIQRIVEELSAAAQASLSPQRGEGLRVRGGAVESSPSSASASDVPTPHPGPLPVEGRGRPKAIGISAPGLAARDGRSIVRMPGRLQGLEGLDWTEFLNCGLQIADCGLKDDSRPHPQSAIRNSQSAIVPVLNDAHAALLGEAWLGAARGFRHVIMLTLGTGVGGAAIVDGKLLRGAVGRAGHLGHACLDPDGTPDICGMPGSLETVIGNCTIAERTGGRFATTHALVAAHLAGNAFATECWLRSVRALACAIGSFINILDPEAVIIGGGIARAGAALFGPLEKFVREVEWKVTPEPVKIIPAQLGELAGAYGAAWNALNVPPASRRVPE